MTDLAPLRDRWEAVPRAPNDDLNRMARGDRSCLADGISAGGAVLTVIIAVLAGFGVVPHITSFLGIAMLVAGFAMGAIAQTKSTGVRRKSLERGPLVACLVVHAPRELYEGVRTARRAIVLFSVDPALRFDGKNLSKIARKLERFADGEIARLAKGELEGGYLRLPEKIAGPQEVYLADVVVYPERLENKVLTKASPSFAAIVDPSANFIEHV